MAASAHARSESLDGDGGTLRAARCARCGAAFACGLNDSSGCWCARLPALPRERYDAAADCLCENCLRGLLESSADSGAQRR